MLPVFHRGSAEGLLAAGRDLRRVALLLATFRRYLGGIDDNGDAFEVAEPHLAEGDWPMLRSRAPLDALTASPFAALRLAASPAFVAPYLAVADLLESQGIHAAIDYALAEQPEHP